MPQLKFLRTFETESAGKITAGSIVELFGEDAKEALASGAAIVLSKFDAREKAVRVGNGRKARGRSRKGTSK